MSLNLILLTLKSGRTNRAPLLVQGKVSFNFICFHIPQTPSCHSLGLAWGWSSTKLTIGSSVPLPITTVRTRERRESSQHSCPCLRPGSGLRPEELKVLKWDFVLSHVGQVIWVSFVKWRKKCSSSLNDKPTRANSSPYCWERFPQTGFLSQLRVKSPECCFFYGGPRRDSEKETPLHPPPT